MIKVQFRDNDNVSVRSMWAQKTYAGLLSGPVTHDLNEGIKGRIMRDYLALSGREGLVFLPPEVVTTPPPGVEDFLFEGDVYERLPPLVWVLELHSYEKTDPNSDGSWVHVVLFTEEIDGTENLTEFFSKHVEGVLWREIAEDFYF